MAVSPPATAPRVQRDRRLSGLPPEPDRSRPLPHRLVRSPLLWTSLLLVVVYAACLVAMYLQITAPIKVEDQTLPRISWRTISKCIGYAWPTLAFWSAAFLILDRFRPQRLLIWLLALGWGASVATYASLQINSWASTHLQIASSGSPASGARAAIYVAPFVEEATKATFLFVIAFLARHRLSSKASAMAIAGLSAAGFAFTENIVYFARALAYGAVTQNTGDVSAAVASLVRLRGVYTSFGHPLFTSMTGLGVAVGIRSRSKVVRVLAPLAGFLAAAFLHMSFNTTASIMGSSQQKMLYFTIAIPFVLGLTGYSVIQTLKEGRVIRARLTDYVRMGWLPAYYPKNFGRLRSRGWLILLSLWHGNVINTVLLQRAVTELAYLRDAMTRGLVDRVGNVRERELIARIRDLRQRRGLDDTAGRRPYLPKIHWRRPVAAVPPRYPGPAGISGHYPTNPAASGAAPLRSGTQYSAVDPSWGPPQ